MSFPDKILLVHDPIPVVLFYFSNCLTCACKSGASLHSLAADLSSCQSEVLSKISKFLNYQSKPNLGEGLSGGGRFVENHFKIKSQRD